jgi:hypothetical protein
VLTTSVGAITASVRATTASVGVRTLSDQPIMATVSASIAICSA